MRRTIVWLLGFCLMVSGWWSSDAAVHADQPHRFVDVPDTHWAAADIREAVNRGIIEGFPDGSFRPDDIVTADQLLVMLFRAYAAIYDTPRGEQMRWEQTFLQRLHQDYPGRLGAIQNALAETPFFFQPNSDGYWAKDFVDFAYAERGYLATFDAIFPKEYERFREPINREQASYLLGMWYKNYENTFDLSYEQYALQQGEVTDMDQFSRTPVSGYVGAMLLSGVVRGYPGGEFRPQRLVTRAEAVSMVMRVREPQRRAQFMPDLSEVCYSQTTEYDIHIFEDEIKCEAYKRIVELAEQYVTDGHVEKGALGVAVFPNKEVADQNTRYWQLGRFDEIPRGEISWVVGDTGDRVIKLIVHTPDPLIYSESLFGAAIVELVGTDDQQALRTAIQSFQLKNESLENVTSGGRKIELRRSGDSLVISYRY